MEQLYKYLKESLLDDEDKIIKSASEDVVISHKLNELNKSAEARNSWNDINTPICALSSYGKKREDYISVKTKTKTLYVSSNNRCFINFPAALDYKQIFNKVIMPSSEICGDNGENNFIKEFITSYFSIGDGMGVNVIDNIVLKNTTINILDWVDVVNKYKELNLQEAPYHSRYTEPVSFLGQKCEISNCKINFGTGQFKKTIAFAGCIEFPKINNLASNVENIIISSNEILKSKNAIQQLDKAFKKNIEYPYGDTKDDLVKKVNSIKDIIAIINNPKKYHTYISRGPGAKPRMKIEEFINPETSLSDVFPWIKDTKQLRCVEILCGKNIITFTHKDKDFIDHLCTKDGWWFNCEKYS